ncbi:hypothetical protein [Streptomyces sp. NPDC046712]|uniref:hypothetical protein n=1 Tax=Streptomyces sp. NPDC046712 TaxID=3154802 RepID=UPI00340EACD2
MAGVTQKRAPGLDHRITRQDVDDDLPKARRVDLIKVPSFEDEADGRVDAFVVHDVELHVLIVDPHDAFGHPAAAVELPLLDLQIRSAKSTQSCGDLNCDVQLFRLRSCYLAVTSPWPGGSYGLGSRFTW